jgi:hypothetical protein
VPVRVSSRPHIHGEAGVAFNEVVGGIGGGNGGNMGWLKNEKESKPKME